MDDIRKNKINRSLQRLGIRLLRSPYCKFPYDRENFLELDPSKDLVIFDVGANIGQSSIWFALNFPNAKIYAFEPFPVIFNRLKENTSKIQSIESHQIGLGNNEKTLELPRIENPLCQTAQLAEQIILETQHVDIITVKTLDKFCSDNFIDTIHILKTDTEGYDIEVLEGAKSLLNQGKILNILSEASIIFDDKQHTNFYDLKQFLSVYNFENFSLYDLHHNDKNGRLEYFNALFKII